MAPRSSGRPPREPFKALCEDLSNSLHKGGIISLPKSTRDAIKQSAKEYNASQPVFEEGQTEELLSILDNDAGDACARLDADAFVTIIQALLSAERSRPGERGMYLLAAALHHEYLTAINTTFIANFQKKMKITTKQLFQKLLEVFTASYEEDHMRVWVGLMLLTLLKECAESRDQIMLVPEETRRKLGALVTDGGDEIIRIVCGKLLTACTKANHNMADFWPVDENPQKYVEFPTSQGNLSWNQNFQAWADSQRQFIKYSVAGLHFSQLVLTTASIFNVSGKDMDTTVVISKEDEDEEDIRSCELSIFAQVAGRSFDRRLDIPLKLIGSVDIQQTVLVPGIENLADAPFDVMLQILEPSSDNMCFVNANSSLAEGLREVRITVKNEATAAELQEDITTKGEEWERLPNGKMVRMTSKSSQESNQTARTSKSSQSAEVIYVDAEDYEGDQTEDGPYEANSEAPFDIGNDLDGVPPTLSKRVNNAQEDPDSLAGQVTGNPRTAYLAHQNLLHSDGRSEIVAADSDVNAGKNSSVNETRSSSTDILHNSGAIEPPHQFSRDKEMTGAKSNIQKVDNQEKSRERIVPKKTVATSSTAVPEAPSPSRKEVSSQSNTAKEPGKTAKKEAMGKDVAKKAKGRMAPPSSQGPPQQSPIPTEKSTSNKRAAYHGPAQRGAALATKGKDKEKLATNNGGLEEDSNLRILQSPEVEIGGQSSSRLASPDLHDASTPKASKVSRPKDARAPTTQNETLGKPSKSSNRAVNDKAGSHSQPAERTKKHSLAALGLKTPKPAINTNHPAKTARNVRPAPPQQVVAPDDSDQDLINENDDDDAVTKKAPKTTKNQAQKSSNNPAAKGHRQPGRVENETQGTMWDFPTDDEDVHKKVPKKPTGKSEGVKNIQKASSKAPATSSKPRAKKATTKNSQQPASQTTTNVEPRPKRQAAVSAATKIAQQTPSDTDSGGENDEEIEGGREEVVEKASRSTGSMNSKKPVSVAGPLPREAAEVEAATGRSKMGRKAASSRAQDKKPAAEPSQANEDNVDEAPNEMDQQLREDARQLSLTHEQLDIPDHRSPAGSPVARIREKAPKKQKNKVAAGLGNILGAIEIDKTDEDVNGITPKKISQRNVRSGEQELENHNLPKERSSVLRFSSSPGLQPASLTPQGNGDGQRRQDAAQPEVIDLVSAPRVGKRVAADAEPSTSKRVRLDKSPGGPATASKEAKTAKGTIMQTATGEGSATPPRQSPRLLARVAGPSAVLKETAPKEAKTAGSKQPATRESATPPRQSPRLLARVAGPSAVLKETTSKEAKTARSKQTATRESATTSRQSPRLPTRVAEPSTVLKETGVREAVLLDDRLARKPPIIAFGKNGARNQGVSSSKKVTIHASPDMLIDEATMGEKLQQTVTSPVEHSKRRREDEPGPSDHGGRANKRPRLSLTPEIIPNSVGVRNDLAPPPHVTPMVSGLNESNSNVDNEFGNSFPDPGTPSTQMDEEAEEVVLPRTPKAADLEVNNMPPPQNAIPPMDAALQNESLPIPQVVAMVPDLPESNIKVDDKVGEDTHVPVPGTPRNQMNEDAIVAHATEVADLEMNKLPPQYIGAGSPPVLVQTPTTPDITSPTPAARSKRPIRVPADNLEGNSHNYNPQTSTRPFGTKVDRDGFSLPYTISKSTNLPQWSSNAKAKPAAPNFAEGKYVMHRETGNDKYEDIMSMEVVQAKRRVEDPFSDKNPRINPNNFAEMLRASRTKDIEPRLPVPVVKPMQRSKSENDKFLPAKDVEFVKEKMSSKPIVPEMAPETLPKPIEPINPIKPINPMEPMEPMEPIEWLMEPIEPMDPIEPIEPIEPTSPPKKPDAHVEIVAQDISNGRPKRKISFQLEEDQMDIGNQPKRIKSLQQSEDAKFEAAGQELQRRVTKQATKLVPPIEESQPRVEGSPRRKVSSRIELTNPDRMAHEPEKKPAYSMDSQPMRRPIPKVDKRAHERRKGLERPVTHPKEHIPKETEDPEKTLVNNPSPASSESTSGSSNLTYDESVEASPEPAEVSIEEEWGVELRSHDRPILESLYRIANGLVSHLVGQREAIEDIVDDYIAGGTGLIEMLERDHSAEKDRVLADFERAKAKLSKSYSNAQRTISRGSRVSNTPAISALEKQWRNQHDDLQSLISQSIKDNE